MLNFIAAFTSMTPYLHLTLGICLMAAAFWTMPQDDAFMLAPLIAFGIARAHQEMAEALDVIRVFAKRRAARHWPATVAQVVRHQSYKRTSGSEDIEDCAVSITWKYNVQGQDMETQTDVFGAGKTSPEEFAKTKFPIGFKLRIQADPTGLEGIAFDGHNRPPRRWEFLLELPGLIWPALLYLGAMGSTVAIVVIFCSPS